MKVKVGVILEVEMSGKLSSSLLHDLCYLYEGESKPVCWILDDGNGVGRFAGDGGEKINTTNF